MYKIDFNNPIHVHFIGIGGISMSGLAKILLSKGFTVSGSDSNSSALTDELKSDGCLISIPQSAGNITNDIDKIFLDIYYNYWYGNLGEGCFAEPFLYNQYSWTSPIKWKYLRSTNL